MSWSEVFKINNDMSTPLNKRFGWVADEAGALYAPVVSYAGGALKRVSAPQAGHMPCLTFNKEEGLLYAFVGTGKVIKAFDAYTLTEFRASAAQANDLEYLAYDHKNKLLHAIDGTAKVIRSFNALTLAPVRTSAVQANIMTNLIFNYLYDCLVTCDPAAKTVKIFDAATLELKTTTVAQANAISLLTSPDYDTANLAYGYDSVARTVKAFNVSFGMAVLTSPAQPNPILSLAYDYKNALMHAADNTAKTIKSFKLSNLTFVRESAAQPFNVANVYCDGKNGVVYVADTSAIPGGVKVFDGATLALIGTITIPAANRLSQFEFDDARNAVHMLDNGSDYTVKSMNRHGVYALEGYRKVANG